MNCPEIDRYFDARLDAQLPAAADRAFEAHLTGCAACRHRWETYAGTWALLGRHVAPEPSVGFVARTVRRLESPAPAPVFWPLWRWAVLAVLVAALGGGGWHVGHHWRQNRLAMTYAAIHNHDDLEDYDVIATLDVLEGDNAL